MSGWDGVTVVAVDGPLAGWRLRWRSTSWPAKWCAQDDDGRWRHDVHAGDGRFEQRGDCAAWRGCEQLDECGRVWTSRQAFDRHKCIEVGTHDRCTCICTAATLNVDSFDGRAAA